MRVRRKAWGGWKVCFEFCDARFAFDSANSKPCGCLLPSGRLLGWWGARPTLNRSCCKMMDWGVSRTMLPWPKIPKQPGRWSRCLGGFGVRTPRLRCGPASVWSGPPLFPATRLRN